MDIQGDVLTNTQWDFAPVSIQTGDIGISPHCVTLFTSEGDGWWSKV